MTVLPVTAMCPAYVPGVDVFLQEVVTIQRRRGKMVLRQPGGQLPVHLLGIGRVDIAGTQSCFHVTDVDVLVIRSQRRDEGGRRVALKQHQLGLEFRQYRPNSGKHACGDVVEILITGHDVEVVVRPDLEGVENLVEHHPVLSGHAHPGLEDLPVGIELLYERRHLYRLRPGAENHQDFPHNTVS